MTSDIFSRIDNIKVWKRGDEVAPHKPLLLLYALGRWHATKAARLSFRDIDRDLTPLLRQYGEERQADHPEYPFWRLQNDGLWEVDAPAGLVTRASNMDPKKSELLDNNVKGGLSRVVLTELERDPGLVFIFAERVLERHFDPKDHAALRVAVGLQKA